MISYALLPEQFSVQNGILRPIFTAELRADDTVHAYSKHLRLIIRTVTNVSDAPVTFVPCISVQTDNENVGWFVPCINYAGNAFGDGHPITGLTCGGEPWVFPSDHSGVPGCTVVTGNAGCSALFLPPEETESACSLEIDRSRVTQRVFFTHTEAPVSYREKDLTDKPVLNTVTLRPMETVKLTAYLHLDRAVGTFGYRSFLQFLLEKYAELPDPTPTDGIRAHSLSFLRRLVERTPAGTLTNMGFLPRGKRIEQIPYSEFTYRKNGRYECGWCGQNISNAWILLYESMQKKVFTPKEAIAPFDVPFLTHGVFDTESEDFGNAVGILDTWQRHRLANGLIPVMLDDVFRGRTPLTLDLCNLGWLAYQYLNCYVLLKNGGIERRDYLQTALGVIDAILTAQNDGGGFPQTVDENGDVLNGVGMAGAMMTVAVLQAYRVTRAEKYLDAGKRSFDFYYDTYLARNVAAGAALDTYCIDKESAGPVLRAAMMLYDVTGEDGYLKKAENTACYLSTWMMYYDVPFPEESDAARLGLRTLGATAVSVSHHHLDAWGSYYAPDLRCLARLTLDPSWRIAADLLHEYTMQGISDGKTELHGFRRPPGAQNEAIFQSNWSFDGKSQKGQLNDWLVSWVNAFRLMDLIHLEVTNAAEPPQEI